MAYSELIKNFNGIRSYIRQFFVYGFKSRDEFDAKSARNYDNEKRRAESWLGDYMAFRQDANGKAVFLSVDSRQIPHNPLYKAWKASAFTKNDIGLHFILLDILFDGRPRTITALLSAIDSDYISIIEGAEPIDESTLRKKLKEYTELGVLSTMRQGKQNLYSLAENTLNLRAWRDAIDFFSETDPMGVIGSFMQDNFDDARESVFSFKHRYLLFSIDSGILLDLLTAIQGRKKIELELASSTKSRTQKATIVPLKIFQSVQGGRQYLAAYSLSRRKVTFFRIDNINKVKELGQAEGYDEYQKQLAEVQPNIWGVSIKRSELEHIEMILTVKPEDIHIIHRLENEKRCGTLEELGGNKWRFSADLYDAWEILPWLRTFIGRISELSCTNKSIEKQFWDDYSAMLEMYGGDDNAV